MESHFAKFSSFGFWDPIFENLFLLKDNNYHPCCWMCPTLKSEFYLVRVFGDKVTHREGEVWPGEVAKLVVQW